MAWWESVLGGIPNRFLLAAFVLILGIVLGILVGRLNKRLLERAGVPGAVEGTAFERTVRSFGTSTVSILATLSMWFIIGVSVLATLSVADVRYTQAFWSQVTGFLPVLFVAILVMIVGIVVGDKVELVISERLRGIKLPQTGVLSSIAKYSIVYIAVLIALGQIGVATGALVVLLGAYTLALIVFAAVAFRDILRSAAAGIFLLLLQPYGIGDEVVIGENEGVVQEISILITRVEDSDREYIVPNRRVFEIGVVRKRQE